MYLSSAERRNESNFEESGVRSVNLIGAARSATLFLLTRHQH